MPAPTIEIHLRKRGALFRSQPVAPLNSDMGDNAVPKLNKTAKKLVTYGRHAEVQNTNSYSNPAANDARYGFETSGNKDMFKFP